MRGAKEFRHDLFKSDVRKMKKNTSFQKGVVKITELEHAHVVHSHNSNGRPQAFTSTVGGHFHAVEFGTDENGRPTVKCGPAMREIFRKTPIGQKREKVPVEWHDAVQGRPVVDNHTHVFEYEGSEILSDRKVKQIQAKNQAATQDAAGEIADLQEKAAREAANDADLGLEEGGDAE